MDKKGNIITILPFKTYLIVLVIGILIYIGVSYYVGYQMGGLTLPSICPKGIIPDRMPEGLFNYNCPIMTNNANNCPVYTWADGIAIDKLSLYCYNGKAEGENINYLYCSYRSYYNKIIKPDGTIDKEINLRISLVIDTKDNASEGWKVVSYKCESAKSFG